MLSLVYGEQYEKKQTETFYDLVREKNAEFNNLNFFIERVKAYNPKGRMQDEAEARVIDQKTKAILEREGMPFECVPGNRDGITLILQRILENLGGS